MDSQFILVCCTEGSIRFHRRTRVNLNFKHDYRMTNINLQATGAREAIK